MAMCIRCNVPLNEGREKTEEDSYCQECKDLLLRFYNSSDNSLEAWREQE